MNGALPIRRTQLVLALVAMLTACAQAPKPLYMWDNFPREQYEALLHQGASPEGQIQAMEQQASKAQTANAVLPPGFRAHLGMLYLNTGNIDKARELWLAEKRAFPESAPYIDQVLKRLDETGTKTANHGANPA
jgi:hypothetical protein